MKLFLKTVIFSLLLVLSNVKVKSQEIWTVGPMLHVNFGGEKVTASFALETAYWNVYVLPVSIDGGIEFDKHKIRIYSEFQTGIGFLGVSAGPLVEIGTKPFYVVPGFQTSAWLSCFAGIDMRYRRVLKKDYFAPGLFVKLPVYFYDKDNPDGNSHNSDIDDDILDLIF